MTGLYRTHLAETGRCYTEPEIWRAAVKMALLSWLTARGVLGLAECEWICTQSKLLCKKIPRSSSVRCAREPVLPGKDNLFATLSRGTWSHQMLCGRALNHASCPVWQSLS